jgi:hypothetical protein
MLDRAVILLAAGALLSAGCGAEHVPPVASSCTGKGRAVVTALQTAPETVKLPDGATISACVHNARSDADLQNVGVTLASAAEDLEARALDGDADAGLRLGYLVGAARSGAKATSGVTAELVRRLERSAGVDVLPAVEHAVLRGIRAGEARG